MDLAQQQRSKRREMSKITQAISTHSNHTTSKQFLNNRIEISYITSIMNLSLVRNKWHITQVIVRHSECSLHCLIFLLCGVLFLGVHLWKNEDRYLLTPPLLYISPHCRSLRGGVIDKWRIPSLPFNSNILVREFSYFC